MNQVYKSKSQVREESAQAVAEFLARGGSIEVVPARKRKVRHECKAKGTRAGGSSNSSLGYRVSGVFK